MERRRRLNVVGAILRVLAVEGALTASEIASAIYDRRRSGTRASASESSATRRALARLIRAGLIAPAGKSGRHKLYGAVSGAVEIRDEEKPA